MATPLRRPSAEDLLTDFQPDAEGLQRALELLLERLSSPGRLPVAEHESPLEESWPQRGLGAGEALERLAPWVLEGAMPLRHPGYFGHMDPPTPWVSWAAAQWSAALNQNLLHPDTSPVACQLEERVVAWLAEPFDMDGGHLVPGSSVANLTALWAAREVAGAREVVASERAHLSLRKAAHLLGMDYREVPADREGRMKEDALGDVGSAALVLTAGTVATGSIDPLAAGAEAAWRHVDAAWAGPLRLSPNHAGLLDGIERADSVALSAHKWLWQPKECAAVLFADAHAAHEAMSFGGGYLAVPNVGVLGSHGGAALPLAATLLAWGKEGVAARIDQGMQLAARLAELVEERPELELREAPVSGVVVWRPRDADARQVAERLDGAYVSVTRLEDGDWLRSVAANPLASPEFVVARVMAALQTPA